jgi:hypothetical protein
MKRALWGSIVGVALLATATVLAAHWTIGKILASDHHLRFEPEAPVAQEIKCDHDYERGCTYTFILRPGDTATLTGAQAARFDPWSQVPPKWRKGAK